MIHVPFKVAAALVLSALLGAIVLSQRTVVALDYRAFYCAGLALRHHENPYRTSSLRDCELHATDSQYAARLPTTTLPAPQPLYDIAFFALLSGLPFAVAKTVWGSIIGIAIFVTVFSLVRLTGRSPPLVLAILATSLIGNTLALGQIVPIYTAALCAAALLLQQGRPFAAGAVAVASLIEPHLGLPLCASLAFWSREARIPVIAGAAALGIVAVAAGGWATNVEYLSVVLPLHALSELSSDGQLSLSVILHALHFPDAAAIKIGSLSYLAMAALGIVAARVAASRFQNRAFLVTLPAAAAVFGGSFLHGTDIVAAIPLALMLAAVPGFRVPGVAAVVLLATPWAAQSQPHDMVPWFAFSACAATYVLMQIGNMRPLVSAACGVLIFAVLCQVNFAYERDQKVYQHEPHTLSTRIDPRYPQASWAGVNDGTFATGSAPAWIMRAPTWAGLLVLLFAASGALRSGRKAAYAYDS